jgi:hypothetical protein
MENNQQIDELFNTAFQSLPEQPIGTWDTPSDAVWTQVQQQIGTPTTEPKAPGSSYSTWYWAAGLSALAIAAWIGYQTMRTPAATVQPQQTTPATRLEQAPPATPSVEQNAPTPSVAPVQEETPSARPATAPKAGKKQPNAANEVPQGTQKPAEPKNNLERLRQESKNQ